MLVTATRVWVLLNLKGLVWAAARDGQRYDLLCSHRPGIPERTLSGGTRQKVSASLAFLFDADLLVLDEPTAGLDPVSSELMLDTLDTGKLRLHDAHFKAIDLLLKQAGKADEKDNIAECRRCCVAILNFEITYPPKHAFWPATEGEPADRGGDAEPPRESKLSRRALLMGGAAAREV